jgi:hypothetical protein
MTGIDLQIHVLRTCNRQLKKLTVSERLTVLKMLTECADKIPEPKGGQVTIPGALEASVER